MSKLKFTVKSVLVVCFIALAAYGGMVSYYYLFPEKERPPIVIPLQGLDLNFKSSTGHQDKIKLSRDKEKGLGIGLDFKDLTNLPEDSYAFKALKRSFLALSSTSTRKETQQQSVKSVKSLAGGGSQARGVEVSGDLENLDFSKPGMQNALPEGITLEDIKKLKENKKRGDAPEDVNPAEQRQRVLRYLIQSNMEGQPQGDLFKKAYHLKKEGKEKELSHLIQNFEERVTEIKNLNPPPSIASFHETKIMLFNQISKELNQIKDSPPEASFDSIVTDDDLKVLATVSQVLKQALAQIFEKYFNYKT